MRKPLFATIFMLLSLESFSQIQGSVPILNSDINSKSVIYIDFNGQYVTGTPWNWNGPINAKPSGLTNANMKEIFASVAADYRIFKVNITTDPAKYSTAPAASRIRLIVTTTSSWYGTAGGVSYVGSYTWGDDTPGWIFSAILNYDPKKVAEAVSHEAGHTLGLQHQSRYDANCNKLNEYNPGAGNFASGWSPIMGVSYYTNASTWMKGKSTISCTTVQDDIATIAGYPNNLFIRSDDAGNTYTTAKVLNVAGTINANGIITTLADKDVYSVTLTTLTRFKVNVSPESVGAGDKSANLNIRLSLLNKIGGVIKAYSPSTLSAKIDTTLKPARYYLVVEGVGSSYIPDYGSVGKYSIQGTALAATALAEPVGLTGVSSGANHMLQWSVNPEIQVIDVEILQSPDGNSFTPVQHVRPQTSTFNNHLANAATVFYQVKVTDDLQQEHFSKVVALSGNSIPPLTVVTNAAERTLQVKSAEASDFEIFTAGGQLYQRGKLVEGSNRVLVQGKQIGVFVLKSTSRSGSNAIKFIFP
ncbi:MAG TPA: hypothetical protein VLC28_12495 [Flavitalea sp.]|nr:hypothetical protein [Flavitalea sp.]